MRYLLAVTRPACELVRHDGRVVTELCREQAVEQVNIAGLPERERSIVLLAYWAGWSDRMIAEDMGCPRSTVQFRRARALAALRDALGGEGDA